MKNSKKIGITYSYKADEYEEVEDDELVKFYEENDNIFDVLRKYYDDKESKQNEYSIIDIRIDERRIDDEHVEKFDEFFDENLLIEDLKLLKLNLERRNKIKSINDIK